MYEIALHVSKVKGIIITICYGLLWTLGKSLPFYFKWHANKYKAQLIFLKSHLMYLNLFRVPIIHYKNIFEIYQKYFKI